MTFKIGERVIFNTKNYSGNWYGFNRKLEKDEWFENKSDHTDNDYRQHFNINQSFVAVITGFNFDNYKGYQIYIPGLNFSTYVDERSPPFHLEKYPINYNKYWAKLNEHQT